MSWVPCLWEVENYLHHLSTDKLWKMQISLFLVSLKKNQLNKAHCGLVMPFWVKISSGNGLLPDDTKPLPEQRTDVHKPSEPVRSCSIHMDYMNPDVICPKKVDKLPPSHVALIHLRAISQKNLKLSVLDMILKFTDLTVLPHLQGVPRS